MTVILAAASTTLCVLFACFIADAGRAAADKASAQLAADAGALAAAAEAGPAGGGRQAYEARRFVEANGGRLSRCDCSSEASFAQVEVVVDGVVARARAVLDPSLLVPLPLGTTQGLDPRLAAAVDRLLAAAGGNLRVVSAWRSPERQEALWAEALQRYGSAEAADDWVARPGHSMHERGLAVDLGGDLDEAGVLIARLGLPLYRPLANEPWHFELAGSRG